MVVRQYRIRLGADLGAFLVCPVGQPQVGSLTDCRSLLFIIETGGRSPAVAILGVSDMAIAGASTGIEHSARNSMPLSAILVDDEQLARDELAYLLKNLDEVNVVAQGKNGLEAISLIKEHNPDLVFLDVQMPGLDGFGVIKKLLDRKVPLPKIIFATAFDQYAVKAFEVNAVDYILKPFDKKRVAHSIERARAKIEAGAGPEEKFETLMRMLESQKPQTAKILIKAAGRLLLTDPNDICYATIEDGVITVATSGHAGMERHSNCRTLAELFDNLDPSLFWRAHRSFMFKLNTIPDVVPWFNAP